MFVRTCAKYGKDRSSAAEPAAESACKLAGPCTARIAVSELRSLTDAIDPAGGCKCPSPSSDPLKISKLAASSRQIVRSPGTRPSAAARHQERVRPGGRPQIPL